MRNSPEHLVVTLGLIMPEVDGLAVLEAVAADEAPLRQRLIIMVTVQTGAASHGSIKNLHDQLGVPLLAKPFTTNQLLDAVPKGATSLTS